jgi:hypothetical protein
MKPGYKTTEFWITLGLGLAAIVIAILSLIFTHGLWGQVCGTVSMIFAFVKAHLYEINRAKLKLQSMVSLGADPTPQTTESSKSHPPEPSIPEATKSQDTKSEQQHLDYLDLSPLKFSIEGTVDFKISNDH